MTVTIAHATTNSGYLSTNANNGNFTNALNGQSASFSANTWDYYVGQFYHSNGRANIREGLLEYNLSAVGTDTVSDVSLVLNLSSDQSTFADFDVVIAGFTESAPWSSSNWQTQSDLQGLTELASINTSTMSLGEITFASAALTQYVDDNKGASVKFCIFSRRTEDGQFPAAINDYEQVRFYGVGQGGTSQDPRIEVTHAAGGPTPITGTLAAQETGTDVFTASGAVGIAGALSAQETGTDVLAASGGPAINGTLSVQETGTDTFAASGSVGPAAISGTLSAQETGADVLAASGGPVINGALTVQETDVDAFVAAVSSAINGTLSAQETGADVLAASGSVGSIAISGTLSAQETGADVLAASGGPAVNGTMLVQEMGADVLAASGGPVISGALSAQETGADVFAASGSVGPVGTIGTLSVQETGTDTLIVVGDPTISGALVVQESEVDAITATGSSTVTGGLLMQETGVDILRASSPQTGDPVNAHESVLANNLRSWQVVSGTHRSDLG